MHIERTRFSAIEWDRVPTEERPGERGLATTRTLQFDPLRVREVVYSPGYLADHWCSKGHVVHVLKGEMLTELRDGRRIVMRAGMTYVVADGVDPHRSSTDAGATLLIVD